MSNYFMGIRTRQFTCSSTEGDLIQLYAQNKECALYTAAELFDLPVTHVNAHHADEWDDDCEHRQSEQGVFN